MVKLIFILVGIVGTFFLVNAYLPHTWEHGFNVFGGHIPWALCIIGGVAILGIVKLSSK